MFNYFKYVATLEPFIGDFFDWWSRWSGCVKYKKSSTISNMWQLWSLLLAIFLIGGAGGVDA